MRSSVDVPFGIEDTFVVLRHRRRRPIHAAHARDHISNTHKAENQFRSPTNKTNRNVKTKTIENQIYVLTVVLENCSVLSPTGH